MIMIAETWTTTTHLVKDGDLCIGEIYDYRTPSGEREWTANYWIRQVISGEPNGAYSSKPAGWGSPRMDNMLGWLGDQDALYRNNPAAALHAA